MTTTSLQQLAEELKKSIELQKSLLQEIRLHNSEWIGPDDAARILGFEIGRSRWHRYKVALLAQRGLLKKVRDGRPPAYYREEVLELSKKAAAGQVVLSTGR